MAHTRQSGPDSGLVPSCLSSIFFGSYSLLARQRFHGEGRKTAIEKRAEPPVSGVSARFSKRAETPARYPKSPRPKSGLGFRCKSLKRVNVYPRSSRADHGGLVFKAHRLCVSLNSRLESNKEEEEYHGEGGEAAVGRFGLRYSLR